MRSVAGTASRAPRRSFRGLGVVLVWGLCPAFHFFDPQLFTHLVLLLAIGALSSTYKGSSMEVARFNAGWWLGLASLLVPSYLIFIPCFIVGISIFRTADLRAIGQLLGGIVIAYFLAGTYAYWRGDSVGVVRPAARWFWVSRAGYGGTLRTGRFGSTNSPATNRIAD